jgi:hypothetical protein
MMMVKGARVLGSHFLQVKMAKARVRAPQRKRGAVVTIALTMSRDLASQHKVVMLRTAEERRGGWRRSLAGKRG